MSVTKKDTVLGAFNRIWSDLFSSPVHLDSLLSKQPKNLKSSLARMITPILLRPVSEAESFGVGVSPGEPWNLSSERLAQWRTAQLVADRIYASLSNPPQSPAPMREDFPPRMLENWEADWGESRARDLVAALANEPPLGLRVSLSKGVEKLLQELRRGSSIPVKIESSNISPLGIRLGGYAPVFDLPAYQEGAFEIQDEGSQFMALFAIWPEVYGKLLSSAPGPAGTQNTLPVPQQTPAWNIVDACAGAGGKSLALGDCLKGKGRIFSYDISETKLQALRRRATRAGLNNIQTLALQEGNEAQQLSKFEKTADLVLVDAPCSGWGVLRRNPDIKWRQDPSQLQKMPLIQSRVLGEYSKLVKPGGRLVFGVCTFRKAETIDVVSAFLEANPHFKSGPGGYLGPGPCDGFFMQSLTRTGDV